MVLEVKDMLMEMVESDLPINRIMREFDHDMTPEQKSLFLKILMDCSKEIWYNKNGDVYRVVHIPHEIRFEYLCGKPYIDIPWTGDASIGVNTADFIFDRSHRNFQASYHERVGSIRYRFNWDLTKDLGNDLRVLRFYFENNRRLAIGRFDKKPGYTICNADGFKLVTGVSDELKFEHAVLGMWGKHVILNYAYV